MEERDYAREYGNRLRQIRQAKGLSQNDLAEKMHTSSQNVSKWEKNGVSNVNTVMQLSEMLGQDITADQIDQEGTVGEIGQEILITLIKNEGYVEYDSLKKGLFGLPDTRVVGEILKLERIGCVIREQYKDYCDQSHDSIFVTAKGIITIKNMKGTIPDIDEDAIYQCKSYESRLEEDERNIQEHIEKNEISKLLWNLPFSVYRIDYLWHLKNRYQEDFPQLDAMCYDAYMMYELGEKLAGENAFFDILYRMAFGYDNETYKWILEEDISDEDFAEDFREGMELSGFIDEKAGMDYLAENAQEKFSEILPWIRRTKRVDLIDYDTLDNEEKEKYDSYVENKQTDYDVFLQHVKKENFDNCLRWFTEEEIRAWIGENYKPAATEEQKEADSVISRVNEIEPNTLYYFYQFPQEWENNGLAQMVRDIWGLPTKDEYEAIWE